MVHVDRGQHVGLGYLPIMCQGGWTLVVTGLPGLATKHDITRYNKIRHKLSCQGWTMQLHRRTGSQEQVKESETPPLPLLGVPWKHQANSHNICRKLSSVVVRGPREMVHRLRAHTAYAKSLNPELALGSPQSPVICSWGLGSQWLWPPWAPAFMCTHP